MGSHELLYTVGESIFGAMAPRLHRLGWMPFPQERIGNRLPARIDGTPLKWGRYIEQRASAEEVARWALQARSENAALILGPVSGNVFVLDVDVLDGALSWQVQQLAIEILGPTSLMRQGRAPKLAMFYRAASVDELPPNRSWKFAEPDGSKPIHGLEILSKGKTLTVYGTHHGTGRYFQWLDEQPGAVGPEAAPIVTKDKLEEFVDRVQDLRPFFRNPQGYGPAAIDWETEVSGELIAPKFKLADSHAKWVEHNGKVVDGRETYMWHVAARFARLNPVACRSPEGIAKIVKQVAAHVVDGIEMSGRWTENYVRREAVDKVGRAARDVAEGRVQPLVPIPLNADAPLKRRSAPRPVQDEYVFPMIKPRRGLLEVEFSEIDDAERARRAIDPDRAAVGKAVSDAIDEVADEFLDIVYSRLDAEEPIEAPVLLCKAPTGTGKTSRTIGRIASDPRTYQFDEIDPADERHPGPMLFLLPTYQNADELKRRADMIGLDPTLSDEDLIEAAAARGLVQAGDEDGVVEEIRRFAVGRPFEVMIYKGKLKAGCMMSAQMEAAMKANAHAGSLCEADVKNVLGVREHVFCQHYAQCPAIAQRQQIQRSHVVILVHDFLTLSIPEELKKVRGVIADERIFHRLVHETTLQVKTFDLPRQPRLTKKEVAAGVTEFDLRAARDAAVDIIRDGLRRGDDPASILIDATWQNLSGLQMVRDAKRICGNAMVHDATLMPNMRVELVQALVATPAGAEVGAEYRFWAVLEERIEQLMHDRLSGDSVTTKRAHGDHDHRLQYIQPNDSVRISWRTEPNWQGVPLMLLDASANSEITSLSLGNREVLVREIPANMCQRVLAVTDSNWSMVKMIPATDAAPRELLRTASVIGEIRHQISTLAGNYAHGRVLVVMPKKARKAVERAWLPPPNVDIRHFGALKGLDFARGHVAIAEFGRLELPSQVIDGIVGALTYDSPQPETPFDVHGTGMTEDERALRMPLYRRTVQMRNRDARIDVQRYDGRVAAMVQEQYREQETLQGAGRGRSVYRETPVDIVIYGQSIPEGMIVDDMCTAPDIGAHGDWWDVVRLCDGVIDLHLARARAHQPLSDEWMSNMFDLVPNVDEVLRQYHRVDYRLPNDPTYEHAAYVPALVDLEAAGRYVESNVPGADVVRLTPSAMEAVHPASANIPADDIATRLGDREARRQAEMKAIDPVRDYVMRIGELREIPKGRQEYRGGTGEIEMERKPLGVWAIMKAWADPWIWDDNAVDDQAGTRITETPMSEAEVMPVASVA